MTDQSARGPMRGRRVRKVWCPVEGHGADNCRMINEIDRSVSRVREESEALARESEEEE